MKIPYMVLVEGLADEILEDVFSEEHIDGDVDAYMDDLNFMVREIAKVKYKLGELDTKEKMWSYHMAVIRIHHAGMERSIPEAVGDN